MKVHLADRPSEDLVDLLVRSAPDIQFSFGPDLEPEAEVLVCGRPSQEQLEAMPSLTSLVIPFAGVPAVTKELMAAWPDIKVHNLHHNGAATAEKAIALLMACAKRTTQLDQALRKGDWSSRYAGSNAVRLEGKRALVIGYGEIGRRIARACVGLGMDVDATKRVARQSFDGDVSIYAPTGLSQILPKADVVLLACPLTEETRGLLSSDVIAAMRPGAMVINIARGDVIDEEALFTALQEGRLGGAGLDVWWNYPKSDKAKSSTQPSRFDFASLDNVVMSPHVGGASTENGEMRMTHLANLLEIIASGRSTNQVDVELGY
jgi:phosphoglycerate dehydrogenase-like enzyme